MPNIKKVNHARSDAADFGGKYCFDVETDGLLDSVSKIHCVVFKDIDTKEVIKGSSTKWNFNEYYPGLVGGHCIGVDPYYLTHKSMEVGYSPEVILSGRRINDNMPKIIVEKLILSLAKKVQKSIPCSLKIVKTNDPRSYRLDSTKLLRTGFKIKYNSDDAIKDLRFAFKKFKPSLKNWNLKWLKKKKII